MANRPNGLSSEDVRRKKTSFTLDFGQSTAAASDSAAAKKAKQDLLNEGVLRSPDVGMLALATPDLERLILQHAYGAAAAAAAVTTPPGAAPATATMATTPTQILFPRTVTEEQEAYARGFLDALLELQRQQQKVITSPHLQVVPDPRTGGLLMPLVSPSEESVSGFYVPIARAAVPPSVTLTSESGSVEEEPSIAPTQSAPVLRPGTLNLADNLSPIAPRRSAVVSRKQFPPFVNDCETLDLSPSGRYATRNLEQSVEASGATSASPPAVKCADVSTHDDETATSDTSGGGGLSDSLVVSEVERVPLSLKSTTLAQPSSGAAVALPQSAAVSSSSLPTKPIDMSMQEQAKIERKREKNRHAAQKCRMLKLERIARLERRVAELKQQNDSLEGTSGQLRSDVTRLRQLIVQHVDKGCQIMALRNLPTTTTTRVT